MTTVTLAPFLLARHELTQAQWARLSPTAGKPRWPSGYEVGGKFVGIGVVDGTHPVETVNWGQAEAVLRLNGLTLPTEAQWEYGCRGGTTTPWFCGDEPDAVEGFGNVLDQTAVSLYPGWRQPHTAAFADGFAGPSPVGRFAANPFGLHDAIGNVWEWCLDPMAQLSSPAAVDTGLRSAGQRYAGDGRIARGGCYVTEPQGGRSGNRNHYPVSFQDLKVGLRAARRLER